MRITEPQIAGFIAAFARTAAWAQTAPMVGDRNVSMRTRAGASAIVAAAIAGARAPIDYTTLFALIPAELLFGALGGWAARLVFAGIEAGGQLLGLQLGLGFAGTFDPDAADEATPTRRIAGSLAGLAFLQANGLEAMVRFLATPLAVSRGAEARIMSIVERGGDMFVASVRVAAPLLLAGVVANMTVAIASRAAPALNAFSVALALFLVVGGVVLASTAPMFVQELNLAASRAGDLLGRLVQP